LKESFQNKLKHGELIAREGKGQASEKRERKTPVVNRKKKRPNKTNMDWGGKYKLGERWGVPQKKNSRP